MALLRSLNKLENIFLGNSNDLTKPQIAIDSCHAHESECWFSFVCLFSIKTPFSSTKCGLESDSVMGSLRVQVV